VQWQLALCVPLLEVSACARGCLGNRVLDWLGKETIDQILMPFVRGYAMDIEAHMENIDMAAKAQRDLQCQIQDGSILVSSIDADEDVLDACTA
jgi:hypothetical protein